MGDKNDGGAQLFVYGPEQVQDLGLDSYIQGGGGLIRDEQLRVAQKSDGDHDALAHAAGQLKGILLQSGLRAGDAHGAQHLDRHLVGLGLGDLLVEADHLSKLVSNGKQGVQADHGLLKDHGDLVAPDPAHLALGLGEQLFPVEADAPGDLSGRGGQQAYDALGSDTFARAGLPHQTQFLPFFQGEADVVHRSGGAVFGLESDAEILYAKHRFILHN